MRVRQAHMSLDRTPYPSLVPSIAPRRRMLGGGLLSALLSRGPERTRGSPPPPSYLRRDLGLMPEEPRRSHWDYL